MGLADDYAEHLAARGFDDTGGRTVCLDCVVDESLRAETVKQLTAWECSFCGAVAEESADDPIAAQFDDFMSIVMGALTFVYHSAESALAWDSEDQTWIGGSVIDSSDAVYELCAGDVTNEVLDAIAELIPLADWTADDISQLQPDDALRFTWEQFRDKVRYSSRFVFLSTPEEHSDHPDEFTTEEFLQKIDQVLRGHQTVLHVPAGRRFWRGRLTINPDDARAWRAPELGPPPRDLASNSRMSPAGVTMFYGADDIATAIAEIGAHSSQRYAVVGEFETTRDLTLLDLTTLPDVPSLYTEAGRTAARYDVIFLHDLAADLAKPIALDGREHIEYVPTQVITEYLRYVSTNKVDGILYRSAQNDGVCCVLFCEAANCINPGQEPAPFTPSWLMLHSETVHAVRVLAVPAPL
ncbi:RES domain-containing protein [Amycolatopsis sp. lyj-23]|uniref:RES domain-containing protein n=1 Tax=Amycolatopsis sp. lyj-23 TaxID=2789283 RepID=UPI00397C9335